MPKFVLFVSPGLLFDGAFSFWVSSSKQLQKWTPDLELHNSNLHNAMAWPWGLLLYSAGIYIRREKWSDPSSSKMESSFLEIKKI